MLFGISYEDWGIMFIFFGTTFLGTTGLLYSWYISVNKQEYKTRFLFVMWLVGFSLADLYLGYTAYLQLLK